MKKRKGVFKQGRKVVKSSKGQSSAHKDLAFEDFKDDFEAPLDDVIDYLRTEEVKDDVSTALHQVSTDRAREGTDAQKVSTDAQKVSTDSTKVSTDLVEEGTTKPGDEQVLTNDQVEESTDKLENVEPKEQTSTPTTPTTITTTFGDDETIAKVLLNMSQARAVSREKEKGVELKDVEESERPRPSSIEAEEEKKRLAEEEAINAALVQELDDVKVRIEAGRLLALRLQEEERDQFAIEERAKFQHDTIAAQRIFLAKQRSAAIRSKPPIKTQLRNQMITYLKHVGGKKHADLKNRKFEDIQALYERIKRFNDRFLDGPLRGVQNTTKKKDGQESLKDKESAEVPAKTDVTEQGTKKRKGGRIKMIAKKRSRPQQVDKDDDELKLSLVITPDEDKEVDYEILDRKYPIIEWKCEFITTKPQYDESKEVEEVNLNVVTRSNGQRRHFSTLMRVLSVFDREDLNAIYHLVMNRYLNDTPEGFDRILWGDLMIMFNRGVLTLMTETGLVIHMLVENKYPLKKEVLSQMLKIKLESKEDSTMALELIRFVKKQIVELELDNSDGVEK
ncbi:hypothetical protein Tco_1149085 [Tanacetum coccineum]